MHAVVYLAERGTLATVRDTAAALHASEHHVAKVFQRLAKAGLVRSVRGASGGYTLAGDPDDFTLADVFIAVEGDIPGQDCLLDERVCSGQRCLLSDFIERVNRQVREYLERTTLGELVGIHIGKESRMYCYQCEQTAKGVACTVAGVCGKDAPTATLQDLLIYAIEGVAGYARRARELGKSDREVDVFVVESLFTTITNVDFDPERVAQYVRKAAEIRDKAKAMYEAAAKEKGQEPETLGGPSAWQPAPDMDGLLAQGEMVSILKRQEKLGANITGLQELIMYGLKGMAAYVDHAQILGKESDRVYGFIHDTLDYLTRTDHTVDDLFARAMKLGEVNLEAMALLDAANTGTYGDPVPTKVRITPVRGKAILVSGHDLKDLEELLKQTEGKGINIYTHGEMLPAHGYPGLKKYPHLVGNYGGAWQDQRKEFDAFPGSILMTTNCIQKPKKTYKDRIFTSGVVAWPGVVHIGDRDFTPLIEAALAAPGFEEDGPEKYITVGFGHNAILSQADTIVDMVKAGKISHFFVVGGCDGANKKRQYYTDFVKALPKDTVIITMGCAKYRFNKLDLGEIDGIPRLLDAGQCNDSYSALQVALALAKAFDTDVNGLPLSLNVSWFEQKAVCILLTLLYLGVKNIRLGPTLPAFITPDVLGVLVEKFNIGPITDVESDLKFFLGK